ILQRFNIQVQLEAAGDYKSFGEPYTRAYASPANREQMLALYGDLQNQLVQGIANGRDLTEQGVQQLLARSPLAAEDALEAKLIDELLYIDQVDDKLKAMLGQDDLRIISLRGYGRLARAERWLSSLGRKDSVVAVVHLEGPIVMGGDGIQGRRITAKQVVPVIRQLGRDDNVKAVVLRVDSGGGSALASDLIARAVRKLGEDKPVVAVYGNIVASGGYYLSVVARELIARPGTITGSIGVVGGKVVVSGALAKQGLTGDYIEAGPDVGMLGPFRPFTDEQRKRFKEYLRRTYDLFLNIVAGGRRVPVSAIEPVAQGRVWTGRQAKERELVDHFGGLRTGISRARMLSGLQRGEGLVMHLDFTPSRIQTLSSLANNAQLGQVDPMALALQLGGDNAQLLRLLKEQPGQALALCPWILDADQT
ncbi:MAG: signal peptide peptidase SppA, partial [Myxococcota bacterium]